MGPLESLKIHVLRNGEIHLEVKMDFFVSLGIHELDEITNEVIFRIFHISFGYLNVYRTMKPLDHPNKTELGVNSYKKCAIKHIE